MSAITSHLLNRVLFVGSHVDDIELFAGGTLRRVVREGTAMTLTFSAHGSVLSPDRVAMAAHEHAQNMASLQLPAGRVRLHAVNACDGSFQVQRDFIYQEILRAVHDFAPTAVITHQPHDTNQDHRQLVDEVVRSCKGIVSILGGEYPFNAVEGTIPNVFVRLEYDDIATKTRLVSSYKSQQLPGRHYFASAVWESLARVRGAQIGSEFAEGFHLIRGIL